VERLTEPDFWVQVVSNAASAFFGARALLARVRALEIAVDAIRAELATLRSAVSALRK
jgi:hypothetical protein